MNLEDKLRQLKNAAAKSTRELELERQLEYLRRLAQTPKTLPAQCAPKGIEHYVEGRALGNKYGEYFVAREALPFGRPYGKFRIADLAACDLSALNLFLEGGLLPAPSRLAYLDTETTGLAGGTGTCAFLVGVGAPQGTEFEVRQFFLRDYPEEKAMLAAVAEALEPFEGVVTFNGKTFDLPLLETRYTLARLKSPFRRLMHLDVLHPARRLWKLRLESCQLTNLEKEVLGISRTGDIPGSEIPAIYFDYLRTGDARGLGPVFYHNAMDIVTLAALAVELAGVIAAAQEDGNSPLSGTVRSSLDLFSLSRIFERAGASQRSVSICQQALAAGLPGEIETRALYQLAAQHKRERQYERAVELWAELARRESEFALAALEELAIYYEHRRRDVEAALEIVAEALRKVDAAAAPRPHRRFIHRYERLQRKAAGETSQR